MGDAADDHQPADEECDADAGEEWDEESEEAGQDQQNAEGDGPANGFTDGFRERGGCAAHGESSKSRRLKGALLSGRIPRRAVFIDNGVGLVKSP